MIRGLALITLIVVASTHLAHAKPNTDWNLDAATEVVHDFLEALKPGNRDLPHSEHFDKRRLLTTEALDEKNVLDSVLGFLTDGLSGVKNKVSLTKENLAAVAGKNKELLDQIKYKVDQRNVKVQDFLQGILGKDFNDILPENWSLPGFSWKDLANFNYDTSLQDFVNRLSLTQLTRPQSLGDLKEAFDGIQNDFCSSEEYTPPEKVPTQCFGPSVTLALEPLACTFDDKVKEVVCDPAKLTLTKIPGGCALKHHEPSSWIGKECKIEKEIGATTVSVLGGRTFLVPLDSAYYQDLTGINIASLL